MKNLKIKHLIRTIIIATLVIFCFGAAGEICGSFFETTADAFGSKFPDNKIEDINVVLSDIGTSGQTPGIYNSSGVPIAIMIIDEKPRALVAWDMANGRQLWKKSFPVNSPITLKGDIMIFQSGFKIVGHNALTGKRLWHISIDEGWDYHGADIFGDVAVITVGVGGSEAGAYSNGKIFGIKAKTGRKLWDNNSGGGLLGTPAIYNNYAFIPWDRQKLAVLNVNSGTEVCRIRADDYTVNYVQAGPNGVYFGSAATDTNISSLFRFDDKAISGTREGSSMFTPPIDPVPGDPGFQADAYAKAIGGHSASEKIRFHWMPISGQSPITMSDNTYYLHYWRFVIALDAKTNRVRWTYRSVSDIESVKTVPGGLVGINADGLLFFVNALNGQASWTQETGNKVLSAVFDANGIGNSQSNSSSQVADPTIGLKELIRDNDNRMLPIRSYAALLVADFPAPEITQDLLTIYSDASIPKGLRDAVVQALKKRTTGSEYLVQSLHMKFDFLEQTQSPPMGVVSPALVNMRDTTAVPGLLTHLMNYETSIGDMREIALAISELGDASVVGTLRQLLTLYHADSSFVGHEDALSIAAEGILKFDGSKGEEYVAHIRDDPQTLPELKSLLFAVLDPEAAAKAAALEAVNAEAEAQAQEAAQVSAEASAAAQEISNRPRSITRDQISETIAANASVLKPCIQTALGQRPGLRSIRLKFKITGKTGRTSHLQILPNNISGLFECLQTGLNDVEFPKFKNLLQGATYTIRIQGQPTTVPTENSNDPQAGSGDQSQKYDPDSFGNGKPKPGKQPNGGQPNGGQADPDSF